MFNTLAHAPILCAFGSGMGVRIAETALKSQYNFAYVHNGQPQRYAKLLRHLRFRYCVSSTHLQFAILLMCMWTATLMSCDDDIIV